jgi:hypothetical protein
MRRILTLALVAASDAAADARWQSTLSPYAGAHTQSVPAGQALPDADASAQGAKAELGGVVSAGRAVWSTSFVADAGAVTDASRGEGDGDADVDHHADGRLTFGYAQVQARGSHELSLDGGLQFDGTGRARLPLAEQIDKLSAGTPRRTNDQGIAYDGRVPLDARHAFAATLQLRRERSQGETRRAVAYLLADRDMTASWQLRAGVFGLRVDYDREPGHGYGPELRSVHALDEAWQLTLRAGGRLTRSGGESSRTATGGVALTYESVAGKADASWQRELESRPGTAELFATDAASLRVAWDLGGSAKVALTASGRRQEALGGEPVRQNISSAGAELSQGLGRRVARADGGDRHAWELGAGGDGEAADGDVDATRTAWRLFARASF